MNRRQLAAAAGAVASAAAAIVALAGPAVGQGLPNCGGNNDVKVAPVTCKNTKTIDGTTFSIVVSAPGNGFISATYRLDAPRTVATPIRVSSNVGISSTNNENLLAGTIPAGSTGPVTLTVGNKCGQFDVKAVYTGRGDARGRVAGPYITEVNDCQETPATTTTAPSSSTTGPTTTTGSTSPTSTPGSSTPASSTATTAVPGGGTIPATGNGWFWLRIALLFLALGALCVAMHANTREP